MKYTPEEIAELLKERPNQPHYIAGLVRRAIKVAVEAERQRIEAAGTSLYERTGDILDMNTLLIQRNVIRAKDSQ